MPPTKDPFAAVRDDHPEEQRVYLVITQAQSDAETGKKYQPGDMAVFPIRKARRWVEDIGIAAVTSQEDYEEWVAEREEQAEARRNAPGRFNRMLNVNEVNSNFAALSRDPAAFDTSKLPRSNEEAQAAAAKRGRASRQGQRNAGGQSVEEQLAALDRKPAAQTGAQGASGKGSDSPPAAKTPATITDPKASSADEGDEGDS